MKLNGSFLLFILMISQSHTTQTRNFDTTNTIQMASSLFIGTLAIVQLTEIILSRANNSYINTPQTSTPWIGKFPDQIQETLSLLANEEKMTSFNLATPKGFLLNGPPGNGKTLLAQHIAKASSASFVSYSAAEMQSQFHGATNEKLRNMVSSAKSLMRREKTKLCVILLDEIDALAIKRSEIRYNHMFEGGIVNQILTLISSEENDNIIFIGATNNLNSIDPALIRSGRLKVVDINNPDKENIFELFKHYITFHNPKQEFSPEYINQIKLLSNQLEGHACRADIKQIVITAATNAALSDQITISIESIQIGIKTLIGC